MLYLKGLLYMLLCLSSVMGLQAARSSPPEIKIHDHVESFLDFWEHSQHLSPAQKRRALRYKVFSKFPVFYDFILPRPEQAEKVIDLHLKQFPQYETVFRQKYTRFHHQLQTSIMRFQKLVPDLGPVELHLVHSFGEMDGGVRTIQGQRYFIFGLDSMSRFHTFENEAPFFHHELLHYYHFRHFNDCEALWCSLWAEGLAVYVAQVLNPKASADELLLNYPPGLIPQVQKNFEAIRQDLKAHLQSRQPEDYRRFFLSVPPDAEMPARSGYYLGYVLARQLAQKHSLHTLIQLSPEQLWPLVRQEIPRLRPQTIQSFKG